MPPFDSLKLVSGLLQAQTPPNEPEELTKGKKDLSDILVALAEKEKEIEASQDSPEKKSERYAKIAEVLKTKVLPVLESWLTKYPEKAEGINKAIASIKALITKYEKKSEELETAAKQRAAVSEDVASGLKSDLPENLQNKNFYKDENGNLRRVYKEGIYKLAPNGALTYRDKTGFYFLAKGGDPDSMEQVTDVELEKKLPPNLREYGFFLDHEGKMRRKGFDGVYELQADKSLIFRGKKGLQKLPPKGNPGDETGRYYIDTNGIKDFPKMDWRSCEDETLQSDPNFPENLQNKKFYKDDKGNLRRKNEDGIFQIQKDGSVIYRDKKGVQKLKAGGRALTSADEAELHEWEQVNDEELEAELPENLKRKGLFRDDEGTIRRKGYNGVYTIVKNGELRFRNKEATQVLPVGADIDDPTKWQVLSQKAEPADVQKSAQNPAGIDLAREREQGFAQLYETSEIQVLLDQYSNEQKLEMLEEVSKSVEISEEQRRRILQAGIIKTALETIRTEIRDSRTLPETISQYLETESTTGVRLAYVESLMEPVDGLVEKIKQNPGMTIDQLLDPRVKKLLKAWSENKTLGALIFSTGQIKEARTEEELKKQYLALVEFLRFRQDYATAQTLVEETLLAPYFEQKRAEFDAKVKETIHEKIDAKVRGMITEKTRTKWTESGMTEEQQEEYIKALIEESEKKELNERIIEMRSEKPFDVGGTDRLIMESYVDMMGAGEWYDMADSTWDTIQEELIINAPLIIVSGGVASLARAGLSTGARAVIATGRFARIGLTIGETAEGVEKVIATGKAAKALLWGGRALGLLAEGTVFEAANSSLQGENLFASDFPEWGSRILWSSLTLGAFHLSGEGAKQVKEIITKNLPKITNKAISAVTAKLLAAGTGKSIEAATMLMIGAVQHGVMEGNFEDWDLLDQILHSCVTVGALTIAGAGSKYIVAGTKKFSPTGPKEGGKAKAPETKEARETKEKLKKYENKEVFVKDSTGKLEGGWKMERVENGGIILTRQTPGKDMEMLVKKDVAEFEAWQKEGEEATSAQKPQETPEAKTKRAKGHIGKEVFVERKDGTAEGGWIVVSVSDGDRLTITKDGVGTKHIRLDKFEATQKKAAEQGLKLEQVKVEPKEESFKEKAKRFFNSKLDKFRPGTKVYIVDGNAGAKPEGDWVVEEIKDKGNGEKTYVVVKEKNGLKYRKNASKEELEKWQEEGPAEKARQEAIAKQKVAEDAAQKVREERLEREYKGKTVFVRRSSGELEGDWKAEQVVGQRIILAKKNPNGGKMVKEVVGKEQVAEFEAWQKEGKETAEKAAIAAREAERNQPPRKPTPEAVKKAVAEAEASAQKIEKRLEEIEKEEKELSDDAGKKENELKQLQKEIEDLHKQVNQLEKDYPDQFTRPTPKRGQAVFDGVTPKKGSAIEGQYKELNRKLIEMGNKASKLGLELGTIKTKNEALKREKTSLETEKAKTPRERLAGKIERLKEKRQKIIKGTMIPEAEAQRIKELKAVEAEIAVNEEALVEMEKTAAAAKEAAEIRRKTFQKALETGGKFNTSRIEELNVAEATELIEKYKGDELDLSGLEAINAETVRELAKFKGRSLYLFGLKTIDAATAKELAEFKGNFISLGMVTMDVATATELAKFKGGSLHLLSLKTIDAATARELAKFKGDSLYLENLETIDAEIARELAGFKGDNLDLGGLEIKSTETARELAKFEGRDLQLGGHIDAAMARELAKFKGTNLSLYRLETIDAETARELARFKGKNLGLGGSIDAGAAKELAKFKGDLAIFCSKAIDAETARELAKFEGSALSIWLDTIDEGATRELLGFTGRMSVSIKDPESKARFEKAKEARAKEGAEKAENTKKLLAEGKIKEIKSITTKEEAAAIVEWAQKSRDNYTLELNGVETLSEQAAVELAKHNGNIYLNSLKSMDKGTARRLFGGFGGNILELNGLENIEDIAGEISKCRANIIHLNGIKTLSQNAAAELVENQRKETHQAIEMKGLKTIDEGTARELAKSKVDVLDLSGIENINEAMARSFAGFEGRVLSLGIKTIAEGEAGALANFKGKFIHLDGLKSIDKKTAEKLASFKGETIDLNGLESVEGIAAELGKFQGSLLLQGVKKISKEALVELSKVHKKDIEFGKLESIEDIAAEMAGLNVDTLAVRMTELSAGAAEKLATFKGGHLYLSHKLNLSPDAAAKLAQYRGTIWGLNEKSKELMEKAPGRKATISKW